MVGGCLVWRLPCLAVALVGGCLVWRLPTRALIIAHLWSVGYWVLLPDKQLQMRTWTPRFINISTEVLFTANNKNINKLRLIFSRWISIPTCFKNREMHPSVGSHWPHPPLYAFIIPWPVYERKFVLHMLKFQEKQVNKNTEKSQGYRLPLN